MRGALFLAPLALAFGACAPDHGDQGKDSTPLPLGFELALAQAATGASQARTVDLSVDELKAMLAKGNVRLIDVRTDAELAEGIIPGAEHIALDQFDPAKIDTGDGREIVIYCRSGRRSMIASERLAREKGMAVKNLEGGILAWTAAGEETVDPE